MLNKIKMTVFKREHYMYVKHNDFTLVINSNLDIWIEDNKSPNDTHHIKLTDDEAKNLISFVNQVLNA